MAVTILSEKAAWGVEYTVTVDSSADYSGVTSGTTFYDKSLNSAYYKADNGRIIPIFSIGALNDAEVTATTANYDIDFQNTDLYKLTASTDSVLTYSNAPIGDLYLVVDNSGAYALSLAIDSGWYSNQGVQPNFTGIRTLKLTYDGSRMFIGDDENMEEI